MASRTCAEVVVWKNAWPLPAWIGLTTSEAVFDREMKQRMHLHEEIGKFLPLGGEGIVTLYEQSDTRDNAILVRFTPKFAEWDKADLTGLIAHEASHVVDYILECSADDSHPKHLCAYLIQAVSGWLAAELQRAQECA